MPKTCKRLPKWQNFAKSGQTSCLPYYTALLCFALAFFVQLKRLGFAHQWLVTSIELSFGTLYLVWSFLKRAYLSRLCDIWLSCCLLDTQLSLINTTSKCFSKSTQVSPLVVQSQQLRISFKLIRICSLTRSGEISPL